MKKFVVIDADYTKPKGSLDTIPYHIRMIIYQMHINSHHNRTINSSILRTCRGIYAELHKKMKSAMINDALQSTDLTVLNNTNIWNNVGIQIERGTIWTCFQRHYA